MKEDLTEHLYHLIEANEERKSKKLEELLHALDVEENEQNDKQLDKPAKNKTENVEKKVPNEKEQKLENTTASLHGDSSETK